MRWGKCIASRASKDSSKVCRLACSTRCRRQPCAGPRMSSSSICWIERKRRSRWWRRWRLWPSPLHRRRSRYRLTTINQRSNLCTLFYKKIHQKSWTIYQAPVSTRRQIHPQPCPIRASSPQCPTESSTPIQCTRTIVQLSIWQTFDRTHNLIFAHRLKILFHFRFISRAPPSKYIVDRVLVIWT